MSRQIKERVQPFPHYTHFPSPFSRFTYKTYNYIDNKLWPIKPSLFFTGVAAYTGAKVWKDGYDLTNLPLDKVAKHVGFTLLYSYGWVVLLRQTLKYAYFQYKGFLFDGRGKPSFWTNLWGVSFFTTAISAIVLVDFCDSVLDLTYIKGPHMITRNLTDKSLRAEVLRSAVALSPPKLKSCDALLPSLPVPDLKASVDKYLESVHRLYDEEEFKQIVEEAEEFLANEGPYLQSRSKYLTYFKDNYITPYWEKYVYLSMRDPLLINSSVAHTDLFKDKPATPAYRLAKITYIECMSHLAIDRQDIKPLGEGLLCANHYDKMYAVSRVPGAECDHLQNFGISRHIVFYCLGHFFKIDICAPNGRMYSVDELTKIYYDTIARARELGDISHTSEGRVAALTHDRRDSWAVNRKRFFLENIKNKELLRTIESAVIFFNYDDQMLDYDENDEKDIDVSHALKTMLTGDGSNRWCDKSLNYTVAKSSRAGGTTEHSIADGAEFDHIMENYLATDLYFQKYPTIEYQQLVEKTTEADWKNLTRAEALNFEFEPEMKTEIDRCYALHQTAKDDVDMHCLVFKTFGKGRIKECKVSPDAFVQMALQLAIYRDQGKFVLTYEPASPRFFKNSRTETLRTVGEESCDFVLSMVDSTQTIDERKTKLVKACNAHVDKNRNCQVAQGFDRHFFVLYCISRYYQIESKFLTRFITSKWILSTSHVPNVTNQIDEDTEINDTWLGACFAAVAKDGYGCCYRFGGNHSILINISSFYSSPKTDSTRFRQHVIDALNELSDLFKD